MLGILLPDSSQKLVAHASAKVATLTWKDHLGVQTNSPLWMITHHLGLASLTSWARMAMLHQLEARLILRHLLFLSFAVYFVSFALTNPQRVGGDFGILRSFTW